MKCPSCGNELAEHVKFCVYCGTPVQQAKPEPVAEPVEEIPAEPVTPPPAQPVTPPPAQPYQPYTPPVFVNAPAALPRENKPLSPWAYYGLQLLFSIPLVGFICLIVFSLDDGNINRRNFARSYWCGLIISLVVIILAVILLLVTGVGAAIISELENMPY